MFYNRPRGDYEQLLPGKRLGTSKADGSHVHTQLRPGMTLQLGDGGARVRQHDEGDALTKKYHLLLRFEDGTFLSVSVQGWGVVRFFDGHQLKAWRRKEGGGVLPLSDEFTYECFKTIVAEYAEATDRTVKAAEVGTTLKQIDCHSYPRCSCPHALGRHDLAIHSARHPQPFPANPPLQHWAGLFE